MGVWPGPIQCAVTLTVHFDAETLWTSRDTRNRHRPIVLSEGHYGAKRGVHALLRLLDAERLRTTFFVPGWVAETYPRVVEDIRAAGHFIGHHGYEHERLSPDDGEAEAQILRRGVDALEAVAGVRPRGYCAPGWEFTPRTIDLLVEQGFDYSANMMDDIFPYTHTTPAGSLVELPVHWLLDDAPFRLGGTDHAKPISPARELLAIWLEELHGIYETGGLFNLTLHPQVSGRPSMIRVLRELLGEIRGLPNVWMATCEDLCDHVQKTGPNDAP